MKTTIPETALKDYAKLLYTQHNESIKDIALTIYTDEATIRNWIATERWADYKRSLLTSKQNILENLYITLDELSLKMKSGKESVLKDMDLFLKYTAAIKNLEGETAVAQLVEVAIQFTTWLRRKNLELAKTYTQHWDAFIADKLKPEEE